MSAGFLVAQLLLLDPHRAPSWDEAVYLSQVSPHAHATLFAASRARGITLLIAPMTLAGGSLLSVRLWLAVISAAGLGLAFGTWARSIGAAAAVAAGFFGASWLALFYGSEVMPNLWSALLGVAACGVLAHRPEPDEPAADRAGGGIAGGDGPRPSAGRRRAGRRDRHRRGGRGRLDRRLLAGLGVGLVAGWAPWIIETSVRFDGPVRALGAARDLSHVAAGGPISALQHYLALSDGPTLGPDPGGVTLAGATWWLALLVFAAVGLTTRDGADSPPGRRTALASAAASGALLLGVYLFGIGGLAPRFLMPGLALIGVPAASGLRRLVAARTIVWIGAFGLVVGSWVGWQAAVAVRVERQEQADRAVLQTVGVALAQVSDGPPCLRQHRWLPADPIRLRLCRRPSAFRRRNEFRALGSGSATFVAAPTTVDRPQVWGFGRLPRRSRRASDGRSGSSGLSEPLQASRSDIGRASAAARSGSKPNSISIVRRIE